MAVSRKRVYLLFRDVYIRSYLSTTLNGQYLQNNSPLSIVNCQLSIKSQSFEPFLNAGLAASHIVTVDRELARDGGVRIGFLHVVDTLAEA